MSPKTPAFAPGTPVEWVGVVREGNQIMAMVGPDLQAGIGGFGDTVPAALRDLADQMEQAGWQSKVVAPVRPLQLVKAPTVSPPGPPESSR